MFIPLYVGTALLHSRCPTGTCCKTHPSWLLVRWDCSSLAQTGAVYTVVRENWYRSVDTRLALPGVFHCSQAVAVNVDAAAAWGFMQKAAVASIKISIVVITQLVPQLENQVWEVF